MAKYTLSDLTAAEVELIIMDRALLDFCQTGRRAADYRGSLEFRNARTTLRDMLNNGRVRS